MFKCTSGSCDHGKENLCCCECNENCDDRCDLKPDICHSSIDEQTQELALFQSKAIAIMQEIAELDRMKKQLEAKDKVVRQELQEAMDKYGVKKFENDILKITYVEPTTRVTIDSTRLKKELPAIADKYSKVSQVKGSVRIEVK